MGIFGRLFGRKKKPAARHAPMGHRGIAAGSLAPGTQDLSAANIAKWRTLSSAEVEAFLYEGELLFVHSTWLAAAQYHKDAERLMVEFKDGAAVLVSDVTLDLAREFAQAQSKGGWYHDRVLGRPWHPGGSTLLKVKRLR